MTMIRVKGGMRGVEEFYEFLTALWSSLYLVGKSFVFEEFGDVGEHITPEGSLRRFSDPLSSLDLRVLLKLPKLCAPKSIIASHIICRMLQLCGMQFAKLWENHEY